ncbi:glycosyltransferase family 2 protein [Vibrio diazotrophicus]|uniref:glycosyltransferase family 2 protein n=1 Tax=Vibrio diazotrophicus TaxID=685 RepID=UPI000C9EC33E|nr:glycosyltransferase family 2 protein [Vibrio diazotrophicus]PNH80583.1 hypothetical protein C1N27_09160 [Vibrio diazotrophicus]
MSILLQEHEVLLDNTERKNIYLSITIPTFKRFDLLEKALNSVLDLKFPFPIEILIVDNCPESKSDAVVFVNKFKHTENIKYVVNRNNIGMFRNWNQCIALSKGKYITILNDDDLLRANFPAALLEVMPNERCDLTNGIVSFLDEVLDEREQSLKRDIPSLVRMLQVIHVLFKKHFRQKYLVKTDFFFRNYIHGTLGVVFKRDFALNLSGFNPDMYPIGDWEFWLRWSICYGKITRSHYVVATYRIKENESFNSDTLAAFPPAVKAMRYKYIESNNFPSLLKLLISPLDKYEGMLGKLSFGNPNEYKFSKLSLVYFYSFKMVQSVMSKIFKFYFKS